MVTDVRKPAMEHGHNSLDVQHQKLVNNMSPVRIELTIFGFLTSCTAGVDQDVRYETDALAN